MVQVQRLELFVGHIETGTSDRAIVAHLCIVHLAIDELFHGAISLAQTHLARPGESLVRVPELGVRQEDAESSLDPRRREAIGQRRDVVGRVDADGVVQEGRQREVAAETRLERELGLSGGGPGQGEGRTDDQRCRKKAHTGSFLPCSGFGEVISAPAEEAGDEIDNRGILVTVITEVLKSMIKSIAIAVTAAAFAGFVDGFRRGVSRGFDKIEARRAAEEASNK